MLGWRLESPDREEVPSVLNAISNTAVADIQELPATVQTLHWVAPQSYLGDRVSQLILKHCAHEELNFTMSVLLHRKGKMDGILVLKMCLQYIVSAYIYLVQFNLTCKFSFMD